LGARLKKNSQNPSKSPSSDAFVNPPPRSLRKVSGRKPGKNAGEQSLHLEPVQKPDACSPTNPRTAPTADWTFPGPRCPGNESASSSTCRRSSWRSSSTGCSPGHASAGTAPRAPCRTRRHAATCYGYRSADTGPLHVEPASICRRHAPPSYSPTPSSNQSPPDGLPPCKRGRRNCSNRFSRPPAPCAARIDGVLRQDRRPRRGALRWVHVACTPELTLLHLAPGRGDEPIEAGGT